MIGVLPAKLKAAMLGGAGAATSKSGAGFFVGESAPTSYITIQWQPQWWLNMAPTSSSDPIPGNISQSQLPLRYFTWADYYEDFNNTTYEQPLPNVKQIVYDDQLSEDASTLTVQLYNIRPSLGVESPYVGANDVGNQGPVFGEPGFMSYLYGGLDPTSTEAQTLFWGRGAGTSGWANLIRENALVRWYFGYGGLGQSNNSTNNWGTDYRNGNIMLKGLFLVDQIDIEANTGLITLTCRCAGGKLLLDQFLYSPLVPSDFYSSSGIEFIPPMPITYYKVPKYGAPGETTAIHPITGVATNAITTGRTKDGLHKTIVDAVVADNGLGYMMASMDGATFGYSGTVFGYGGLPPAGESGAFHLIGKIIGMDQAPLSAGYWLCDNRGTVYNYGTPNFNCLNSGIPASTAPNNTSTTNNTLDYGYVNQLPGNGVTVNAKGHISLSAGTNPVVAFRANSTGEGYWMITQNGTIYTFGAAGKITVLTGPADLGTAKIISATYFTLTDASGNTLDCMYLLDNIGTVYAVGGVNSALGNYSYTPIPGVTQTSGTDMPYSGPCAIEANIDGSGYWVLGSAPYPTVPNTGVVGAYSMVLQSFGSVSSYTPPAINGVDWTETGGIHVSPPVNAPAFSLRITDNGDGLYIFGTDGAVYTLGDALFFGSMPAEYTLWVPSNYVSFYNTSVYMLVPEGTQPPTGATKIATASDSMSTPGDVVIELSYAPGAYASPSLLAPDYSQIVRLIWLWAGGYLPTTAELVTPGAPPEWSYTVTFDAKTNPNAAPPLLGAIFDSGAFDALGPIDSSTFDKVTCKQGINAMRDAIGFITRFRDDGGLVFNLPNIFRAGNFFEDQTYMAAQVPGAPGTGAAGALGAYSWNASAIPTFGEGAELPLQDFTLSSLDSPLRSQIIVSPVDPAIYDNSPPFPNMQNTPLGTSSTITSLTPSTAAANILHGLIKVAMLGVPLNVPISVGDQDLMAEYEYIQSWCATRVGTLVAPFNPQVTTDTQIRIIERVTGETGIHYVTGISVTHNLDQGDCLATYTTQWMGDVDNAWQVGAGITNATFNEYGVQQNTTTYTLSSALANAINVWLSVNVPQGYLNSYAAFAT
jgi:hypothetical protein